MAFFAVPARVQAITLTFDHPETAGISGMRPFWDRPVILAANGIARVSERGPALKAAQAVWANDLRWHQGMNFWIPEQAAGPARPGAIAFDAVHRSLLVRFPGAAEAIAQKLREGFQLEKAEIRLPFQGTEKMVDGYKEPTSFIGDMWMLEPRWHAVAWALRQPWQADLQLGPTFNASINGARYWTKYGAADETHDRFSAQFGPAELSAKFSEGLDITASLTSVAFGGTLSERLRRLADCGFLVKKWEFYDAHFISPGYEWGIMTGGRGILTGAPQLVVTFKTGAAPVIGVLPPAADITALAARKMGEPSLKLPSPAEFAALKQKYAFSQQRPGWMSDWQWQRVNELYNAGGQANTFPQTLEEYQHWIDMILATPPRNWEGFSAADQLMLYYEYKDALPSYIGDHWKRYWTAWLMPERDTWTMTHNQYHQIWTKYRGLGSDYVDRTGDWRGDKSFYRESYTRYMSTMNFNHTAALGALLGGHFIGADKAIADGRYGLEMFPLRLWAWYDGTLQEGIDHYYLSITMTDQKTFADYGPTLFDRLMGRSILTKSMEELSTCFHPVLKRFVSTGGRTTPFYATQEQDGVMHIIHSLSKEGALTDLDKEATRQQEVGKRVVNKVPIIGHDLSPRRVALQTLKSPWGPEWLSEIIDYKPLPFEVTSTFRMWGAFLTEPRWKKSYLGAHYGLTSYDFMTSPTLNLQGLWSRAPGKLATADDLGQLLIRFGYNRTNFIDTMLGGTLGSMGGTLAVLQHHGKMLLASSPNLGLRSEHFNPAQENIRSVQTSICLFTLQDKATWKIFVDGKEVTALPFVCKASARITIQDGLSFLGVIPLATSDLGRDAEVMLKEGGEPVRGQSGEYMRESLLIESYFYRGANKLDLTANASKLDEAYGGFMVELSDNAEYQDFAAFQRHIHALKLTQRFDAKDGVLHLACQSGKDLLEMGFIPKGAESDDHQPASRYIPYRRVNGKWPYLPEGIERETPLSILGRKGVLEKNDARLTLEPNQMGYLVTEPRTGTYLAANPLPDASWFRFEIKNGATMEADGRIGLGLFTLRPKDALLDIDYAIAPGSDMTDLAHCLLLSGLAKKPVVTLNGAPLRHPLGNLQLDGKQAWLVPLSETADLTTVTTASIAASRAAAAHAFAAGAGGMGGIAQLVYEQGEHYLLTRPGSGIWNFQRQWPSGVAFRAETPEGLNVSADGRLAILQLLLDTRHNRVELVAPKYLYDADSDGQRFSDKALALLIFGAPTPPAVVLNGQPTPARCPRWKSPVHGSMSCLSTAKPSPKCFPACSSATRRRWGGWWGNKVRLNT